MIYKTVVVDYAPKTKKMADSIEEKANEMSKNGYELVTIQLPIPLKRSSSSNLPRKDLRRIRFRRQLRQRQNEASGN